MNKHMLTFCTVFTLTVLLAGCRSKAEMLPATEPSRPLATVESTATEPHPTLTETMPELPMEDPTSVHTVPPEELTEATIEDGNGPIPSQENPAETK